MENVRLFSDQMSYAGTVVTANAFYLMTCQWATNVETVSSIHFNECLKWGSLANKKKYHNVFFFFLVFFFLFFFFFFFFGSFFSYGVSASLREALAGNSKNKKMK